jgi:EAL domain-containing protein (putative c-di-GMP-specific phosphodiesterase class I)
MPLSYVKLDGSYVKDLLTNPVDQVFVKSMSEMVKAFGMQTIAEFVGDAATYERLLELGVTYGQGFFIGQPKPYLATIDEIKQNMQ